VTAIAIGPLGPIRFQIFFIVTGFLINLVAFFQSITTNFPLAAAVIGALLIGKWIAVQTVGRTFAYTQPRA
jgi:hypothetical protein